MAVLLLAEVIVPLGITGLTGYFLVRNEQIHQQEGKAQLTLPAPSPDSEIALDVSPVNAVAIRQTTLGQYLESINTDGTWVQSVQQTLGVENPISFSALDAMYVTSGAVGLATLVLGGLTPLALIVSPTLLAVSAIGMSEEDRKNKLLSGVAAGGAILTNPAAAAFVVKEAFNATKETVKQTAQLAQTGIGFTTAALGFGSSVVLAGAVISKRKNNKRKHS
jgi:hypothetical protein